MLSGTSTELKIYDKCWGKGYLELELHLFCRGGFNGGEGFRFEEFCTELFVFGLVF